MCTLRLTGDAAESLFSQEAPRPGSGFTSESRLTLDGPRCVPTCAEDSGRRRGRQSSDRCCSDRSNFGEAPGCERIGAARVPADGSFPGG